MPFQPHLSSWVIHYSVGDFHKESCVSEEERLEGRLLDRGVAPTPDQPNDRLRSDLETFRGGWGTLPKPSLIRWFSAFKGESGWINRAHGNSLEPFPLPPFSCLVVILCNEWLYYIDQLQSYCLFCYKNRLSESKAALLEINAVYQTIRGEKKPLQYYYISVLLCPCIIRT